MSLVKNALRASLLGLLSLALVLGAIPLLSDSTVKGARAATASGDGSTLVSESFQGTSVADSRWLPLGDACLTGATSTTAPSGASSLASCARTQDTAPLQGKVNGFLQLTDNSGSRTSNVLYDRAVPTSAGLDITFTQWQYNLPTSSTGIGAADGIGFFLTDGAYSLTQPGPTGSRRGGALGYATIDGQPGISHGVMGLGLDAYGNFSAQPYVGTSCPTANGNTRQPGSVAVRGAGDDQQGYCLISSKTLSGTGTSITKGAPTAGSADDTNGTVVHIVIDPTTSTDATPAFTISLDGVQVLSGKLTDPLPPTVKLGFSSSTGGGHQAHLIRNVSVATINKLGAINIVKAVDRSDATGTDQTVFAAGDTVPYSFTVTNAGEEALTGVAVHDPRVSNIVCPVTTLAVGDSMTCTATHLLTAAEADVGSYRNVATASGTTVSGDPVVSNESEVIVPTTRDSQLFRCNTGVVYSLDGDGDVHAITSTGEGNALFDFGNNNGLWNALGVSEGGESVYATRRSGGNAPEIWRKDLTTGILSRVAYNVDLGGMSASYVVAGGVDLQTGRYVFGGPRYSTNNNRFQLFAFDGNSVKSLGYVSVNGFTNGDIAFDALGNLYLVTSTGGTNFMYRVDAQTLQAAYTGSSNADRVLNATVISTTTGWPTSSGSSDSSAVNGIAFQTDGRVFLGDAAHVYVSDITTWSRDQSWAASGSSSDLASCASPPTVRLQKNVQSRYATGDQFSVNLTRTDVSPVVDYGTGTTTGQDTGVQDDEGEFVGPVLTASGRTLAFSETGANGADLSNYDSSWKCTDASGQTVVTASGGGGSGQLTVPTPASWATGLDLVCTITNADNSGTVQWQKAAADSGKTALAGSEWTLTRIKDASGQTIASPTAITVTDCVQSADADCTGAGLIFDVDHAAGAFQANKLQQGTWTLTETKAPPGYVVDGTSHQFVITDAERTYRFPDPFANRQQSVPSLPLTGGASADVYLIAGALLLMLSCALGIIGMRRRKGDAKRP